MRRLIQQRDLRGTELRINPFGRLDGAKRTLTSEVFVRAYQQKATRQNESRRFCWRLISVNKEVKRRADGVGIFPNEESIVRLIGAVLLEANDEWQLQHRYMQVEAVAELDALPADAQNMITRTRAASRWQPLLNRNSTPH